MSEQNLFHGHTFYSTPPWLESDVEEEENPPLKEEEEETENRCGACICLGGCKGSGTGNCPPEE